MRQVRQARFITNNMHSPPQVTLLTVNTAEQTVRRLHSRVRNWGKLNVLVTRALEWSGMVGPGLALDSSISLENSDGGQWENILLVFSLARRHLLSGLPVLLCSWAWTLRVVDVLCCGAGVWLRMWEVILLKDTRSIERLHYGNGYTVCKWGYMAARYLLLIFCAWRMRVQSGVLRWRRFLLIESLLLLRLLKQPSWQIKCWKYRTTVSIKMILGVL